MSESTTLTAITIDPASIDSLRAAIKAGVTTPELLADWIDGAELVEDALVIAPDEWHVADSYGGRNTYDDLEDGIEDFADTYRDSRDTSTSWIDVAAWREGIDADGDVVRVDEERRTVQIDPEEPKCSDGGEHDWQSPYEILGGCKENPGVWGHGGGVIVESVCMKCGCSRKTDTWAQNPSNGEQGLESVSYEPGKYADEIAKSDEDEDA